MNEIATILSCSKSTVSYHCSSTTRLKASERGRRLRNEYPAEYKFISHMDRFVRRERGIGKKDSQDWNKRIRTAVSHFKARKNMNQKYTYKEAITHLGGLQTKCYLTGTPINLETDSYCLDHILPVSKGGTNELNNMGITIPSANASKSDLQLEEFFSLCKLILENNGYTVTK